MDKKEYTIISYKRDYKSNEVYALCYYWEDGKRKFDQIRIPYYFFYSDPDIEWDSENFRIVKGFTNVHGKTVNKIIPKNNLTYDDYKNIQEKYGGRSYESDVKAIDRFMWEDKPKFSKELRKWYIDIEVLKDEFGQYSSVEDAKNKIASITFYDTFVKKYYVFLLVDSKKEKIEINNRKIYQFESERDMLDAFIKGVDQLNPDIFTGWNISQYDMPYLVNRMTNLSIEYQKLSPLWNVMIKSYFDKFGLKYNVHIKGRGIIDLIEISRQFWLGTDVGYSLESQSRKWLNDGKINIGDISKAYKKDFNTFVEYNIKDVELTVKLDRNNKLIEIMQKFQDFISINLDETVVAGKLINSYIKQHSNIVLTNSYSKGKFALPGGYVHPVAKGIFKNVLKFDFVSHYPSIIRTYGISPDTIVYNPTEEEKKSLVHFECYYKWYNETNVKGARVILPHEKRPNDALKFEVWFRKDFRGSITKVADELTDKRLMYKKLKDTSSSTVLKRIINSLFGQIPFEYSRFYNKECGMAITLIGQYLTKSCIYEIEKNRIGTCIMGDTDSFAIELNKDKTSEDILLIAEKVFEKVKINHNLDKIYSQLELESEIEKMILFGVKKKYAQYIQDHKTGLFKQKIQGLEMIRKDFPDALKEFQKEIITKIFENDKITIVDLNETKRQIEIKIRSAINRKDHKYYAMPTVIKKPIDEYESNTAEKKALMNSKLKISVNEQFYILPCEDNNDLAFKDIDELEAYHYRPDYNRIIEKVFNNVNIFEDLFIKQTILSDYSS